MKKMRRVLSIGLSIMMLALTVNFTAFAESTEVQYLTSGKQLTTWLADNNEQMLYIDSAATHAYGLSGLADATANDLTNLGAKAWDVKAALISQKLRNGHYTIPTFVHSTDRASINYYYQYAENVTALPESADFFYTRSVSDVTKNSDNVVRAGFMDVIYAISNPTSVPIYAGDGTTEIGKTYTTTLYTVGFNLVQIEGSTKLAYRYRTFDVIDTIYDSEELGTNSSTHTPTVIASINVAELNDLSFVGDNPNAETEAVALARLMKVHMTYGEANDGSLNPTFVIQSKYSIDEGATFKTFTITLDGAQTVTNGTKKAVGIYVAQAGATLNALKGAFADPVVTFNVPDCVHELTHVEAKESTETENGNTEYWHCEICDKYYADAERNTKLEQEDTVIEATGYNVRVYSLADGVSVSTVSGGGNYKAGSDVTITATKQETYAFKGWYKADVDEDDNCTGYTGEAVCKELTYTFKADAHADYVAVYEANGKVSLTVNGYGVTINGKTQLSSHVKTSYHAGTEVTVTYNNGNSEDFKYWMNGSGKIVSKEAEYTFTLVNATELILVTAGTGAEAAFVEFVSAYNQVLYANTWYSSDSASDYELPIGPSKVGYDFTGWSMDGNTITDVAGIINAISSDADSHIVVSPMYTKSSVVDNSVTVTVYNGAEENSPTNVSKAQGSTYTVVATEVEGSTFSYWVDGEETILSYNPTYTLLVSEDIIIKAVYDAADVEVKPVVAITGITPKMEGITKKVTIVATRSIPSGYTFVQAGMLYDNAGHLNAEELDATLILDGSNVSKLVSTSTAAAGAYVAHIIDGDSNIYARAYIMVMNDATGNIETYYSSPISTSFETLSN